MIVFFVGIMPLFYWSVQGLFDNTDIRLRDVVLPFLKGALFSIAVILFYWAMDIYFNLSWNPLRIYLYTLLNKEGFLYLPVILLVLGLYWKKEGEGTHFREISGIFCGYYFFIAAIDVINGSVHTTFDLLLLPVLRVVTLIASSVLISRMICSSGRKKYGILIGIFLLPLFFNLLPLLYLLNKHILFYLFFVPVSLAVFVLGYLDLQEKLPW